MGAEQDPPPRERRRSPRRAFDRAVRLQVDDVTLEVAGRDISLHGIAVRIDGSIDLGPGDLVLVALSETTRLPAMVVSVGADSLHLAFVDGASGVARATLEIVGEGPAA